VLSLGDQIVSVSRESDAEIVDIPNETGQHEIEAALGHMSFPIHLTPEN
jgi:hypothetical protein